ncbi:unnamed protein product [Hymenolepis diminuta]|uniref:RRM domain-containing protein n=1 Tax=Hymenolepis diminuta TaxID=6216 RepID=A0A564YY11_HYMDI|nr:unnamed protein product [Hymenolepis diminuta]
MSAEKFRVLMKNVSVNAKVSEIKKFFKPIRIKDAKILKRGVAVAYFKSKEDLDNALQKEGEIHGSIITILPYEDDLFTQIPKNAKSKPVFEAIPKDQLTTDIKETGRLYIRNLSYEAKEEELRELFEKFGDLSECHLCYDKKLQRSKGFAFVTYLFPDDAVTAFNKLDKTKFKNRLLHILPGKQSETNGEHTNDEGIREFDNENDRLIWTEFQQQRKAELKSLASVGHNWNALFMTPDAVATYLSAKYNVSKEELLNPSGKGSVAVRLAHGEAQLVQEIREYLERQGVRIDLLTSSSSSLPGGRRDKGEAKSSATNRVISGRIFLLKNLPVGSTQVDVEEIVKKKSRKGANSLDPPKRIIVPPLGITAILEYTLPQIARLAYHALAYEPYNDNILYVEWLPDDILRPREGHSEESKQTEQSKKDQGNEVDPSKYFKFDDEIEEDGGTNGIQVDAIERMTSSNYNDEHPKATAALEVNKKDKKDKKSRKRRMQEQEEAKVAAQIEEENSKPSSKKTKQDKGEEEEFTIVQKPSETVSLSEESEQSTKKQSKPEQQITRILLVRNVSFQANQNELTEFFKPIGGLLKVRMPKKPSGGHRGFAFVEFASEDQARSAMATFGTDSHFMGRRLNIEYAKSL